MVDHDSVLWRRATTGLGEVPAGAEQLIKLAGCFALHSGVELWNLRDGFLGKQPNLPELRIVDAY